MKNTARNDQQKRRDDNKRIREWMTNKRKVEETLEVKIEILRRAFEWEVYNRTDNIAGDVNNPALNIDDRIQKKFDAAPDETVRKLLQTLTDLDLEQLNETEKQHLHNLLDPLGRDTLDLIVDPRNNWWNKNINELVIGYHNLYAYFRDHHATLEPKLKSKQPLSFRPSDDTKIVHPVQ